MADYIPSNEAAKLLWLWNLAMWLWRDNAVNGLLHGFSIHEVNMFRFTVVQAKQAANTTVDKEAAARAAVRAKKDAIAKAVGTARDMARRLQADPNTTDAERAAAGITVPDATKTAASPDDIRSTDPPSLWLDFSRRLQVIIHWGPNPHDERHNGRPHGTIGCEIQFHRGGIPTLEADWVTLDIDTDSPFIHTIHEDTPTTYAYRACYVDKKLNKGPYGDPAVCTVSV